MSNRPLVKNAADPRQVRYAERKERRRADLYQAALREVLGTLEGRLVFGDLLEEAGLYRTVFDHSGSVMNFNEGRRNFGLELQATLVAADETLYDLMERERRARRRAEDRETEAVQTRSVQEDAAMT